MPTQSKFEKLLQALNKREVGVENKSKVVGSKSSYCLVRGETDSLLKLKLNIKDSYGIEH